MAAHVSRNIFARRIDTDAIAFGLPPKDPHKDDDENEEDEEHDNEEDQEPAVIRALRVLVSDNPSSTLTRTM